MISDRLVSRGGDPVALRKYPIVVGLLLAALLTSIAPFASTTMWVLVLMSSAMFCAYGAGSCSWALGTALTPPSMVATLESVQNIGGSIGGALAPLVTGLVVQHTGSFNPAFIAGAVIAALSAGSYALVGGNAYDRLFHKPKS